MAARLSGPAPGASPTLPTGVMAREPALFDVNPLHACSSAMGWRESMKPPFRQQAKAAPRRSSYFTASLSS
jgi:hypothetical protein